MKILFLDFLYPIGHRNQNASLIEILSTFSDVIVVCPKGYYDAFINIKDKHNIHYISDPMMDMKIQKTSRSRILRTMLYSAKIKRIKRYESLDCIIIASYDTILFPIWQLLISHNTPEFIIQHNNIDGLKNAIKRICFYTFAHKQHHLVFEEFIAEYLVNHFRIAASNITVIPHQMNVFKAHKVNKTTYQYYCVGLSSSNDESFIQKLINMQKKDHIFKKKNSVYLKSSLYEYNDGCLCVHKGYLSNDEYANLLCNSKIVFMPFPSSFRYRASGTLSDGIANGKIVVGTDIPILRYYSKKMPHSCFIIQNTDDFIKFLSMDFIININEIQLYINAHSNEQIENVLRNLVK